LIDEGGELRVAAVHHIITTIDAKVHVVDGDLGACRKSDG